MPTKTVIFMSFIMASCYSFADCIDPQTPSVVDGNTASKEAMIEYKNNIKNYMFLSKSYLTCLQQAEQSDELSKPKIQGGYTEHSSSYVDKVSQMEAVKNDFKQQVSNFKSR
ncbi:hypothetical protein SIN8267_00637 [Sinobacterium norvegicum]|uniref:Lipoprotein n=1 Tax=Sinobacterium norvegicum TaxID=1641715 RepID=A0ABN8EEY0_9GAMM|nr:hypothetical protein [Sinobacterium norvegicum]CAH0990544.1 hypothetical protein SIN8267_00637 [Sinobacterium norvegicum]